jgi:hypothetical protein
MSEEVKEIKTADAQEQEAQTAQDNNPQNYSDLKRFIVTYCGVKREKQEEVTMEDILEVLAEEFPEVILTIAEENWVLGYRTALEDRQHLPEAEEQTENKSSEA